MCLASPGEILSIDASCPLRRGNILFGRIKLEVCLLMVPEAQVGDYVLVHAGIAIANISANEALSHRLLVTAASSEDDGHGDLVL